MYQTYQTYGAPLPGVSTACSVRQIWNNFMNILKREPSDPTELQEFTFVNHNEEYITYLESYYIFMNNSTNEYKKNELQKYNNKESLLVLGATKFDRDSFQWIPKNLRSINAKQHNYNTQCLFPFPSLNGLYHQQTDEYVKMIKTHNKKMQKINNKKNIENKHDVNPTCTAKHKLTYLSPNALVNTDSAYFNGQYIAFLCDMCRNTFPNTYAWHCDAGICQYDLCQSCYDRNAPPPAPLAPLAPQYNRKGTQWPPTAPMPAPLPSLHIYTPSLIPNPKITAPGAAPPIKNEYNINIQRIINRYEDTFIYNNLYEYINYNQDIYEKLFAFNQKKKYVYPKTRSSISAPLSAPLPTPIPAPIPAPLPSNYNPAPLPGVPPPAFSVTDFLTKNIDYSVNETDKTKMNMISVSKCPFTVCYKIENISKQKFHCNLKHLLNEYELKYDNIDIHERPMTDKKGNISTRKWKVKGIVDPDKHLTTLQHCNKLSDLFIKGIDKTFNCISYYHWIPTVFKVNNDLTKCDLVSEIPNLDPYKYKNNLYVLISKLFLSFVKQFEYITYHNLREYELECIVKIQDYIINDIKWNDNENSYYGNFHKEGLYEDIIAVGLYYYHVSNDIKGGELALTCIKSSDDRYYHQKNRKFVSYSINVCEGTQIVFNNYKCFHRVNKLYGNGNRKIIAFHLINPKNRLISAKHIIVNWKHHTTHFIQYYCRKLLDNKNVQFICDITVMFVIGDKKYIDSTTEIHNECRRNLADAVTLLDKALGDYYANCGRTDYYDSNGIGKFRLYFEDNQYDVDSLEDDLGTDADPEDCAFTDMDDNFPLHNQQQSDIAIFNVIQYCYQHHKPPNNAQKQPKPIINNENNENNENKTDPDNMLQKNYNIDIKPSDLYIIETLLLEQCADLRPQQTGNSLQDEATYAIIQIGKQNNNQPLLIYLVDAFNRYRIQKRKKTLQSLKTTSWNREHFRMFNEKFTDIDIEPHQFIQKKCNGIIPNFLSEYKLYKQQSFIEKCQSAISVFPRRLLHKPPMKASTVLIKDDIIAINRYIFQCYTFIDHFIRQKNSPLPTQIDIVIIPKAYQMINWNENEMDDSSPDEIDDNNIDIIKDNMPLNIGDINKRLLTQKIKKNVCDIEISKGNRKMLESINSLFAMNNNNRCQRGILIIDRRNNFKKDKLYCFQPNINKNKQKRCDAFENDEMKLLSEALIQNLRICILPKVDDEKENITVNTQKPFGLTLSFHCFNINEVRVYLCHNGWGSRFFLEDIKYYLPQFFVDGIDKLKYADRSFADEYVKCKQKCPDQKFETFYKKLFNDNKHKSH